MDRMLFLLALAASLATLSCRQDDELGRYYDPKGRLQQRSQAAGSSAESSSQQQDPANAPEAGDEAGSGLAPENREPGDGDEDPGDAEATEAEQAGTEDEADEPTLEALGALVNAEYFCLNCHANRDLFANQTPAGIVAARLAPDSTHSIFDSWPNEAQSAAFLAYVNSLEASP